MEKLADEENVLKGLGKIEKNHWASKESWSE